MCFHQKLDTQVRN